MGTRAKVETITVREGEPFELDWKDEIIDHEPTTVEDAVAGIPSPAQRLIVLRRGF